MSPSQLTKPQLGGLYPPTVEPAPRPLPLRHFLIRFVKNPLSSLPQAVYEQGIVAYDNGRGVVAWVTDPALIEEVLLARADSFGKTQVEKRVFESTMGDGILTSQGASWKWQRRTAAPLFRPADLAGLVPAMTEAAEEQLRRWAAAPAGSRQAVDRDMTETTFRVISTTMFAGSADAEAAAILHAADKALSTISWDVAAAMLHFPHWLWYPGKYRRARAGRDLREAVRCVLARRRANGLQGNDLLARLARARDPQTGAPMSEKQLVDNLVTFLAAGHETTAKALTWTLYLMARAPEWQHRIRREVREVAGDEPITAEHIEQLTLTRAVLEESMRLYPPAPVMTRQVIEDTVLGGERLPAGAHIVISIFAVHRHRKLWTDPDRFDPDRFLPERKARYARTQFMPFGFGPRTCIGASFAMLEGLAILATLVRRADFEWDGDHAPEPLSRVTLRPKGGMPLHVWPLKEARVSAAGLVQAGKSP
jgi:cytochrome P450